MPSYESLTFNRSKLLNFSVSAWSPKTGSHPPSKGESRPRNAALVSIQRMVPDAGSNAAKLLGDIRALIEAARRRAATADSNVEAATNA